MQLSALSHYPLVKHLEDNLMQDLRKSDPYSYRIIQYLLTYHRLGSDYMMYDLQSKTSELVSDLLEDSNDYLQKNADLIEQVADLETDKSCMEQEMNCLKEALEENKQVVLKERQNFPTLTEDLC
jgi:hypothetical protein